MDDATWKLTDGTVERHSRSIGKWPGFTSANALAHVVDKGIGRPSWHAVRGGVSVGPAAMEAAGLADNAGLLEAKLVAEAMVTGDVGPLAVRAHQLDDCTEDVRLTLQGMLSLIAEASTEEPDEEEGTEASAVPDDSPVVARIKNDWRVVSLLRGWVMQRWIPDHVASLPRYETDAGGRWGPHGRERIEVGAAWESYGLFHDRRTLLGVVELLAGDIDPDATAALEGLPARIKDA